MSTSLFHGIPWSCSPDSLALASPRSLLTPSLLRGNADTSSHSRPTPGSFSVKSTDQMLTSLKVLALQSRSTRNPPIETHVPLWEQSPRSTTISVCFGHEQEFPTVSSVESRSVGKVSKTLPTAFLRAKLGGVFRFLLP